MKNGTTTTFRRIRQLRPIGDQRRFFHVDIQHLCVTIELPDFLRLPLRRDRAVIIQAGAMCRQSAASSRFPERRRNLGGALQKQMLRHLRMTADRIAIFPNLTVRRSVFVPVSSSSRGMTVSREITFADEIRDHINFTNRRIVEEKERVAQTRFLFPKSARNVREKIAPTNLAGVRQARQRSSRDSRSSRGRR